MKDKDDFSNVKIIGNIVIIGFIAFMGIRAYLKSIEKTPTFKKGDIVEIMEIDPEISTYEYKDILVGETVKITKILKNFGGGWLLFEYFLDTEYNGKIIKLDLGFYMGRGAKVEKVEEK